MSSGVSASAIFLKKKIALLLSYHDCLHHTALFCDMVRRGIGLGSINYYVVNNCVFLLFHKTTLYNSPYQAYKSCVFKHSVNFRKVHNSLLINHCKLGLRV